MNRDTCPGCRAILADGWTKCGICGHPNHAAPKALTVWSVWLEGKFHSARPREVEAKVLASGFRKSPTIIKGTFIPDP